MSGTTDLKVLAAKASEQALALVRDRFETGRGPGHMHYHNRVHTRGVIDKARAIGAALGMTERELLLTTIAAAFHDTVQDWEAAAGEGGATIRVRNAGANEVASAKEAIDWINRLGAPFAPEEQGMVASAIIATIPSWSAAYDTIVQPFLTPGSHKVARAVALADLGSAGMDPATFLSDGPALFAEENLDVMEALEGARTPADIPADRQEAYRARYVEWLNIQPGFARGRRHYFAEAETADLDAGAKERLQALFSHFGESIAAAEQAVARAEGADFVTLMRQLDPRVFPDAAGLAS